MQSSMIYTIGTALNRAHQLGARVEILVEGQWISGTVVAVDGHGLVLTDRDLDHSVVRLEHISAIRVEGAMPGREPVTLAAVQEVRPMPPRQYRAQEA